MTNSIINRLRRKTNWYVITGGPGSGKTTTVNLLKERGHITTFEHARHYLDTQRLKGKPIEDVRKHQKEFQLGVLDGSDFNWVLLTFTLPWIIALILYRLRK